MTAVDKACSVCAKPSPASSRYLVCSRCKLSAYCSTECQKIDWPTHKTKCKTTPGPTASDVPKPPMIEGQIANYLIKFQVYPGEIENPAVWRTLSIPANCDFDTLHIALQDAFGWAATHTYEFVITNKKNGDTIVTIDDNEGDELDPMGKFWKEFYGKQTSIVMKAAKTKLYEILEVAKYKTKPIMYAYDMGDYWEHHFTLLGTVQGTSSIICTDGGGHSIAEDAGNVPGWQSVLDAYRATSPTKKHLERRKWYEGVCFNGDKQGLHNGGEHRWDKARINRDLKKLRLS